MDEPSTPDGAEPDGTAGAGDDPMDELADELEHARFTIAFRGFEPREVQELLRRAANQLRALRAPGDDGRSGGPLDTRSEAAGAGRSFPVARAEAQAAEILRAARSEAERIVASAEREAEKLREEARAATLDAIRKANAMLERSRREASGDGG